MPIQTNRIEKALHVLVIEEDKVCRVSLFTELRVLILLRLSAVYDEENLVHRKPLEEVIRWTNYISQDLWEIEALFDRLDWQRELWVNGTLDEVRWSTYSTLDIDHFHLILRSVFDYMASLLRAISNRPGELGSAVQTSFNKLKGWISKHPNSKDKTMGADIAEFILGCEWFDDVRIVRDSLAHFGGSTLTFPIKPMILFQTHEGKDLRNAVTFFPEVMYNDHVVDFELYAGLIYAYLLDSLERLADLIIERLELPRTAEYRSRSYNFGMRTALRWIGRVRGQSTPLNQSQADDQIVGG